MRQKARLYAAFLVMLAMAWHTPPCAEMAHPHTSDWGIDRFPIYTHFGYEPFFYEGQDDLGAPQSQWNFTSEALLTAHLYRLEAGLGVALRLWGLNYPEENEFANHNRVAKLSPELKNAWLRYPFGADPQGAAIQAGVMPLQSHDNAILFGNYLVRKDPHHDFNRRVVTDLDSLGSLAPSLTGIALTIGDQGAPARAEAWLFGDDEEYSLFGLISGTALHGFEWGFGFCAYRIIPQRDAETYLHWESSDDSIPDTVQWTYRDFLFSGQAAIDIASLLKNDNPKGLYGGLFAEVALLGWKHNPFTTMGRFDRLIWTLGAHLPTFGWLDVFVVQLEKRPQWNYRPEWSSGWATPHVSPWSAGALLSKSIGARLSFQFRVMTGQRVFEWSRFYTPLVFSPDVDANETHTLSYSTMTQCLGRIVLRFP